MNTRHCSTLLVWALLILSATLPPVFAACGPIPGTYPLYSDSTIKLGKNITVNSQSVSAGTYTPNAAIDINGNVSTNTSQSLPDLDPPIFPVNTETADLISSSNITVNSTTEVFYDEIRTTQTNRSITFTGGGPFHINTLETQKEDSVVNFAAGTYYINQLILKKEKTVINVISSPVIIHIGTEFKAEKEDVTINKNGSVDGLIIYLHSGASFIAKKENFDFTGLIYGPNNVNAVKIEKENSSIHGAIIISGGTIEIKKENVSFTYTSSDQTAISSISTCTGGGGGDTAAFDFNCVETGTDGINGTLYTKTTGQSFTLDIIALQDATTIETSFASGADHTVSVELVDASSGDCLSHQPLIPAVSQNLIFTSGDSGVKTSTAMSSAIAYRNVKCRVTDNTDATPVTGCSTDAFVIRPTGFTVVAPVMNNTGSSNPPAAKTGTPFTMTATASGGYDGVPAIDKTRIQDHNLLTILPVSFGGGFNAADPVGGIADGVNFNYQEVGNFRFLTQGIYDSSFTTIDQSGDCTNDFSNSLVGGKVGCKFGNIADSSFFGRFIPDHFDVTLNSPEFSPACTNFTYIGQPLKYQTIPVAGITAKNALGTTTRNYTGSYFKIDPNDATYGITPSYSESTHALSVLVTGAATVLDNGDGTATLNFADTSNNILGVTRNAPEAAFDAEIALAFTLSDTDGVIVANVNGSAASNPVSFGAASAGNGIDFSSGNKNHRWGRLAMANAFGSELMDLPVSLNAEYFNGSVFVSHTDDNCTNIGLTGQLSLSNPDTSGGTPQAGNQSMTIGSGSSTATLANSPLASGDAGLSFSSPGAGNTGYIDITSDFSSLDWLLFDWDNNGVHDDSPKARASFGIFKGDTRQIYIREVY